MFSLWAFITSPTMTVEFTCVVNVDERYRKWNLIKLFNRFFFHDLTFCVFEREITFFIGLVFLDNRKEYDSFYWNMIEFEWENEYIVGTATITINLCFHLIIFCTLKRVQNVFRKSNALSSKRNAFLIIRLIKMHWF